ncbi:hypothetical protein LJR231_005869 [Phyllobacterium sp. LjRoot231]|uniref:hypothetical protein n=1 Tax=Phyllobacterium sp. LjRoot231 TaxID=3342289 RepID=UPI003ECD9683
MDLHDLRARLAKGNDEAEALIRDIQEMLASGKMPGNRAWTDLLNGMMKRYESTIEANQEIISRIDDQSMSVAD